MISSPGSVDINRNNFDILRLLFASMVVFFHVGILSQLPAFAWTQRFVSATFAVQAFFVVSGILVTMSCEKSSSLWSYASKRIRRIVPAYVTVVVGAALCLSMLSELPLEEYLTSPALLRYLGFNLILSNFAAPTLPGVFVHNHEHDVNASLWTIKIEVAFYCSVPLIVYAVRRWGYRPILAVLFVTSLAWKGGFLILAAKTAHPIYAKLAKQLPAQLAFFMGGAWLYYQAREKRRAPALVLALLALPAYILIEDELALVVVQPVAVTAIIGWAALNAPKIPPIAPGSDFSYGIYLYHFPFVQAFVASGLLARHPVLSLLALICIVATIAVLSWRFVERPFLPHRKAPAGGAPASG